MADTSRSAGRFGIIHDPARQLRKDITTIQHQMKRKSCGITAVEKDLAENTMDSSQSMTLNVSNELARRFLGRISRILRSSASMQENTVGHSVSHENPQTRIRTEEELKRVEHMLASIAKQPQGLNLESLEDLWDLVLLCSYEDARTAIHCLERRFKDNHEIFADFITNILGVDIDYSHSELDQKLGGYIIQLSQDVQTYDQSMRDTNSLIGLAAKIRRELDCLERMNYLIRNALFANELFELICKLSFPERAFGTLISVARTSRTLENVTFRDKPSSSSNDISPTAGFQPQSSNLSMSVSVQQQPKQTCTKSTSFSTLSVQTFPIQKREIQQEVTLLIETISRNRLLPKHESAWYSFGFVCTRNEEEERRLAGLYAVLIQEANSPQTTFHEIHHALETNSLATLFTAKGYENFREYFPHLEAFLSTPPERRPTAWRLKQFVADTDKTEPPACLRRDYGFNLCKLREEVVRLKSIYGKILNKLKPEDLHSACMYGRLFEAAVCAGVTIDAKDRRLMQNDYPSPLLGFDNNAGLAQYRRPLFKKPEKL